MKEGISAHITELKRHADLGPKPKSVQPIHGEVSSAGGKSGENSVFKHVEELQRQASLKGEPAPFQPNPKERQASERLGKPPPQQQEEQKEKERLQELFASSLSEIVEDKSDERFSEKWLLRQQLSPYLDEFPFLAEDIPALTKLRDLLNTPLESNINYAFGVFDAWDSDAEQRRELQIRQILSEAKRRHS